jgi:hypothetical protein
MDLDASIRGQFADLSYCRETSEELERHPTYKAVASNKGDLQSRGVSMAVLPRAIREAIIVCGWLNIQYIWIDSLCILQDSEDDWQREALKMETVYSMSKLTIMPHPPRLATADSWISTWNTSSNSSRQIQRAKTFRIRAHKPCRTGFHGIRPAQMMHLRIEDGPTKKRFCHRGISSLPHAISSGNAKQGQHVFAVKIPTIITLNSGTLSPPGACVVGSVWLRSSH